MSEREKTQSDARFGVVAVYETPTAREQAVLFLDQLAEQHRATTELDVTWWPFNLLRTAAASDAAEKAARAGMVVFALSPVGDLPQEIKAWIECWLGGRAEREGAIIGLIEVEPRPGATACLKEIYLRHVAHRAGMDYLSHAPSSVRIAMPDSAEAYTERAGHVSTVLNEILHTQRPPAPPL